MIIDHVPLISTKSLRYLCCVVCKCTITMCVVPSIIAVNIASHVSPQRCRIAAVSVAVAVAGDVCNVIVIAVDLRAMMAM